MNNNGEMHNKTIRDERAKIKTSWIEKQMTKKDNAGQEKDQNPIQTTQKWSKKRTEKSKTGHEQGV